MHEEAQHIVSFIKEAVETYHFGGIVIGISGGIDSAVAAALCVRAIGKQYVRGLILTERDSAAQTRKDAGIVCDHLGISYRCRDLSGVLRKMGVYRLVPPVWFTPVRFRERYVRNRWRNLSADPFIDDLENRGDREFRKGLAYYRIKHRTRMAVLYMEAEKRGYAVTGTTNRTELSTGFYVKYGDEAADIDPLAHLYKTSVVRMGGELGLPEKILSKAPSPDLLPGITDESVLGMNYEDLDRILGKIDADQDLDTEDPSRVQRVKNILDAARNRKLKNLAPDAGAIFPL
jgi:NAD+ synthase